MATFANRPAVLRALSLSVCGVLLGAATAVAADGWLAEHPIQVLLTDGRMVHGTVERRAGDDHFWLRSETERAVLHSRFTWSSVDSISQDGAHLNVQRLRQQIGQQAPREAATPNHQDVLLPPPLDEPRQIVLRPLALPQRVQALRIETRLANWDADALPDGLLVTLYPLTSLGEWTPVRGTLDLTLLAEVWPRSTYPDHPLGYPKAGFHELARASHLVREVDFARGPATFRLPFTGYHPEAATQIATYGIVQARLGVNGQGVFEAADPLQRLREPSPTRDRWQLLHGRRQFSAPQPAYWP